MASEHIDEFGALLIKHVRDEAISACDTVAQRKKSPVGRRWAAHAADVDALLDVVIPDVVDEALFRLLHAIDSGLLKVSFTPAGGSVAVDLTDEGEGGGELAGWYMGDDETGWRNRFSAKRFMRIP